MKKIKKAAAIALAVVLAAPLGFKLFNMNEPTVIINEEGVPLLKSFFTSQISIQEEDVPLVKSFMLSSYTDPILEVSIEDEETPL